jgi:hypothetical protein
VRLILGITLFLLGIGLWSCQIDGLAGGSPSPTIEAPWVRTVDGWERAGSWHAESAMPRPRLHPLVVAAGQLLLSLLALTYFDANRPQQRSAQ